MRNGFKNFVITNIIFTNNTQTSYKLSARNTSLSTLSGFSCAHPGVLTCPTLLKSLSDGELLAWMARYLRADETLAFLHRRSYLVFQIRYQI